MAGPPRRRFSLSKLPHSLAIALWVVGSSWAVMIAAGIAVVIVVAVNNAGTALNGKYEMILGKVQ